MQLIVFKVVFRGVEAPDISVQVHISNSLPAMVIVGLAGRSSIQEKGAGCAFLSGAGIAGQKDSGKSIPDRFTQRRRPF